MSGGFRRSSAFGIVGVIVVMVAVALIALQFGSGTAHPTGALIAIVGIVFGFIAILMVLQRRDLNKVSGAAEGEALAEVGPVSDPTTVPPGSLIAAMAVRPVESGAGGDGITVERRRDSSGFDWLCDLWLAERLADAVRA
jgi:hypothetical protein